MIHLHPTDKVNEREAELVIAVLETYYIASLASLGPNMLSKGVPRPLDNAARQQLREFAKRKFPTLPITVDDA